MWERPRPRNKPPRGEPQFLIASWRAGRRPNLTPPPPPLGVFSDAARISWGAKREIYRGCRLFILRLNVQLEVHRYFSPSSLDRSARIGACCSRHHVYAFPNPGRGGLSNGADLLQLTLTRMLTSPFQRSFSCLFSSHPRLSHILSGGGGDGSAESTLPGLGLGLINF